MLSPPGPARGGDWLKTRGAFVEKAPLFPGYITVLSDFARPDLSLKSFLSCDKYSPMTKPSRPLTGLLSWERVDELIERIKAMPGFGDYKARVYAAVLARQFDVKPDGWDAELPEWPNISEVSSREGRSDMKARKKAWKAARR